eukprot:1263522-Pyramimonas_sp.AAC.1
MSHHWILCTIPRSVICRMQLVRPKRVHRVSLCKSLLDKDVKTDSAPMVKVTWLLRQPNSSMSSNWVGVSDPAWSSNRVTVVG